MTVPGTLAQWREWTGLPLEESGAVFLVPPFCTPGYSRIPWPPPAGRITSTISRMISVMP